MESYGLTFNDVFCVQDAWGHFVEEPKVLSCGHFVCTKCIGHVKQITCKRCNQLNSFDLSISPTIKAIEAFIESNMATYSRMLYDKLASIQDEIKGTVIKFVSKHLA